ncbi:MAG: flagellar basal body-associated protein FliL [Tardiphaga sp.]|jgi:flagellar FliL protein|uniref:flagellar basal body-associated protein FliL n=1 Tax=Tardiphaga sp. TaxID=1926292 RepID=UPI00263226C0|nr:flagellar basal body-associated protein FliL [Tardiphaga sp.]MDB5502049.1 flagellar basal body-associated protein FliL [Tardiphaga sp.]
MADNDSTEDGAGEAAAPKSKFKLIAIVVVGLVLASGAGAYFFLFSHPKETHAEVAAPKPPSFLDVPEILVNLAGQPGDRVQYLKAKIVLEIKDEKLVELIKPSMPRITDMFQTYMRELRATDLNGSVGMFRLKEELTKRVNAAVSPSQVTAVLFKEILIQ